MPLSFAAMKAASIRSLFALALFATAAHSQAPTPAKRVVILDDGSLVEGTVESFDGVIRITPALGSAKIVPARQIAFAGETRAAAYDFAAAKVDATTADGARQLAEWCDKVGMADKALLHAKVAIAGMPNDKPLREMIARLEKPAPAKPVATAPKAVEAVTPAMAEFASGAGAAFATKVQPILTNQCASCHAAKDYSGSFKLDRIALGYANPEAVSANMKAVAAQLSRENPANSPLLRYGLAAHGGQKRAAFASRELPAYQNLEAWVLASLPRRNVQTGFVAAAPSVRVKPEPESTALPGAVVGALGQPVVAKVAPPVVPPPAVAAPIAKPNAADPFDPQSFNRLPKKSEK